MSRERLRIALVFLPFLLSWNHSKKIFPFISLQRNCPCRAHNASRGLFNPMAIITPELPSWLTKPHHSGGYSLPQILSEVYLFSTSNVISVIPVISLLPSSQPSTFWNMLNFYSYSEGLKPAIPFLYLTDISKFNSKFLVPPHSHIYLNCSCAPLT